MSALAPALDLRPANGADHPNDPDLAARVPANIDAEQAVLGCVLCQNDAFHLIDGLEPQHFYEPFHARLWDWIAERMAAGGLAEAALSAQYFERDAGYLELGAGAYLGFLVDRAPPPPNVVAYAREVSDLAMRRDLLRLSVDLSHNAVEAVKVEDAVSLAESALLAMQVASRRIEPVTAAMAAARVLERLDGPEEVLGGILTGLSTLDEELGPLQPGNLVALAGRTSMGKSAAAEVFAYNIAERGLGVIQINGEMTVEEMAERHLADLCQRRHGVQGPEYRDIRRRRIGHEQRLMLGRARDELAAVPLVMLKRTGLKFSQLRSIARRQTAIWARRDIKLGALIVDHMGLIRPDHPSRDRYADQTAISNGTKELAEELGCPLLALLQLNRETEKRDDKRPKLSDIRDSGAWEQDADLVIAFYREAYYARQQIEPKKDLEWSEWDRAKKSPVIEAIILKARSGPPQTVKLWGDVARNAIRSHAPEGDLL
jgi:replicative DNA helicase